MKQWFKRVNPTIQIGTLLSFVFATVAGYYLWQQKYATDPFSKHWTLETLQTLDLRFNDIKFSYSKKDQLSPDVLLVAVDDESVQEIGRFPWGRDIIAQLTDELVRHGANAIGMDVIFSEPERGRANNDQALASVVERHKDKIILGTFSNHQVNLPAYQDYCINEAFLQTGGDDIVKLNVTLIVNDEDDKLEDLDWRSLFQSLFSQVRNKTEIEYLQKLNKKSTDELAPFQNNFLAAQKVNDIFTYCTDWLTNKDYFYTMYPDQLKKIYDQLFSGKTMFDGLSAEEKIQKFKKTAKYFPIPQYGNWQSNIPDLQKASDYTASFIATLDNDGYVRHYPLFYRSGNKLGASYVPSLALQTYLISKGYRVDVNVSHKDNKKHIESFKIIDPSQDPEKLVADVPIDQYGRIIINYYGPAHTFPYISAKDLFSEDDEIEVKTAHGANQYGQVQIKLEKRKKAEFLKGKSILFGATSTAIYDIRNTPVAANFPGPEIHMTALSNLDQSQFIQRLENEAFVVPLAILILGFLLSIILSYLGAFQALICLSLSLVLATFVDHLLFSSYKIQTSSFFIFLHILLLHFFVFLFKYAIEESKKKEVRKAFSKYVAPAVVDELLKNDKNIELGGKKQDLTVFFSDVRGFTSFSEKMDPQELSSLLSSYLTPMTEIVFNNKGTLDKYMGDGLMAFFGAPVAQEDHAYNACVCALESIERLKIIQKEFADRGWPPIEIGIGVNSGAMSVGNMGSKIVQSYTVLGDAVNLGARLEAATKSYGARILVGEDTYEQVKDQLVFREVDRVRVKGKQLPVRAYELLQKERDINSDKWVLAHSQAYETYHERKFTEALALFSQIKTDYPADKVAELYIDRCQHFIDTPPDSSWDGVYERRTK